MTLAGPARTMETQTLCDKKQPNIDYHSTVDTSRPFRSVKEAVAIFGERLLVGEIYSAKPYIIPNQETISWKFSPSPEKVTRDEHTLVDSLKKLEAELEETKVELKLLKERESETEVALASLNAELHKNMSKMAKAEAVAAGKAAATAIRMGGNGEFDGREEERREIMESMESNDSPTLAQILSIGEKQGYFGRKERKVMKKKKPIIPLVGDLFSRKKGSSTTLHNPLYSSSHVSLN